MNVSLCLLNWFNSLCHCDTAAACFCMCVCVHLSLYPPECLSDVFTWLGFDVEVHPDCTSEKMLSVFRELGERDHQQMDCVACCVLSHGLEGRVHGVDSHSVDIKDLKEPLNARNCETLAEKPKLFFVQACQGRKEQSAVHIVADGPDPSLVCSDSLKDSIPAEADFLMSMATVPDFVSFRDKKKGTWFIQSLCKNLVELVPRWEKLNIRYCWMMGFFFLLWLKMYRNTKVPLNLHFIFLYIS